MQRRIKLLMFWKEFLFTGLYTGYFPKGSGTVGAFLALLFYIIIHQLCGKYGIMVNLILVTVILYPSIKLGDDAEIFFAMKDPQAVVLDEMLGFWVTMLFHSFSLLSVLLGFIFFRLFDIMKPYPIQKLEHCKGGLGIMMDDIIAGVYANGVISLILFIMNIYGIVLV
ncbi:MAG: phosphatidylglycerophosphatase A [Spirochaetes bacterium]|nr:phosphatidylglycerophosphatase A [Spirochaetota bacterium]